TAIDTAGNSSAAVSIVGDTDAPSVPTFANDGARGLTGISDYQVQGIADNAKVEYSTDGKNWSTGKPGLQEGNNIIYVRQPDQAGNTSANGKLQVTLDTTEPSEPNIENISNQTNASGEIVATLVSGEAEAGSTVTVLDAAGTPIGSAVVGSDGKFVVKVVGG